MFSAASLLQRPYKLSPTNDSKVSVIPICNVSFAATEFSIIAGRGDGLVSYMTFISIWCILSKCRSWEEELEYLPSVAKDLLHPQPVDRLHPQPQPYKNTLDTTCLQHLRDLQPFQIGERRSRTRSPSQLSSQTLTSASTTTSESPSPRNVTYDVSTVCQKKEYRNPQLQTSSPLPR